MKDRRRARWAVGLLLALGQLASGVPAARAGAEQPGCEPGVAKAAAQKVQTRYEGVRDLRAAFRQTSESASFAGQPLMSPEAKTGRVVFAKPGKMRWTYLEPERSQVVSDGETLWIYDVDGKTATRFEVTSGFLTGAALQFLLGDGKLLESFEVAASSCEDGRVALDLLPRQDASYERLGLVTELESGDVVATSVVDLFGNVTRIEFSELEVNLEPPSATFELDLPDDVEVIDYAEPPTG